MTLPLYKSRWARSRAAQGGHAGLWYDKFCDAWTAAWTLSTEKARASQGGDRDRESEPKNPKLLWIEQLTAEGRRVGDPGLLAEAAERAESLARAGGGRLGVFVLESRFVSGLGRTHPVENGFAWHPTLGVPYLPGSSVKGLVRAWARATAGDAGAACDRVLGGAEAGVGRVAFLDAVPLCPSQLGVDVLTPHYAAWTPRSPPGDWCAPVPSPFLAVEPGAEVRWSFGVVRGTRGSPAEVELAFGWLVDALRELGAGAKTAVGYGRFRYDRAATDARVAAREAARRSSELERTPAGRWELRLAKTPEQQVLELVKSNLEKGALSDPAERVAFAQAVIALGHVTAWERGSAVDRRSVRDNPKRLKACAALVRDAATGKP